MMTLLPLSCTHIAPRHHDTLNAPVNVQSLYFTFQFYHFAPTTTVMSYLVQPNPALQQLHEEEARERGAPAPDPTTVNATRLLVTNHPHRKGAGVTIKYVVDATLDAVPSGQTAQQAAFEGSMHFSQYLAAKTLSVDVWDGESLLQVGLQPARPST
jgi:nephrocystin-4